MRLKVISSYIYEYVSTIFSFNCWHVVFKLVFYVAIFHCCNIVNDKPFRFKSTGESIYMSDSNYCQKNVFIFLICLCLSPSVKSLYFIPYVFCMFMLIHNVHWTLWYFSGFKSKHCKWFFLLYTDHFDYIYSKSWLSLFMWW